MSLKDPTTFTVSELKEQLRDMGLPTAGTKTELIARLTEADPAREWLEELIERRQGSACEVTDIDEDADLGAQAEPKEESEKTRRLEFAEKEMSLLRLENEILRQRCTSANTVRATEVPTYRRAPSQSEMRREYAGEVAFNSHQISIQMIADLLSTYSGELGEYDKWERQLQLLREMYRFPDEQTRVLLGMRLKGKALEWFHSKPEHVSMPIPLLLNELREMFSYRPNVLTLRKKFEERTWKRGETFREYVHDKVIMANRVPIDDREMVPYLLQGIPDPQLRDQARLLKIRTKADLLEAFEDVMLRGPIHTKAPNTVRDYGRNHQHQSSLGKSGEDIGRGWRSERKQRSCYSCGAADHVGHDCPTKGKGIKCFKCRDYGHIASECKNVSKHVKDVNVPEVFNISAETATYRMDLSHILIPEHKKTVEHLIESYKPNKTREVEVEMNVVLTDNVPVYQRSRRSSPEEKEEAERLKEKEERKKKEENERLKREEEERKKKREEERLKHEEQQRKKKEEEERKKEEEAEKVKQENEHKKQVEDELDALQGTRTFNTLSLQNELFMHLSKTVTRLDEELSSEKNLMRQLKIQFEKEYKAMQAGHIQNSDLIGFPQNKLKSSLDNETKLRNEISLLREEYENIQIQLSLIKNHMETQKADDRAKLTELLETERKKYVSLMENFGKENAELKDALRKLQMEKNHREKQLDVELEKEENLKREINNGREVIMDLEADMKQSKRELTESVEREMKLTEAVETLKEKGNDLFKELFVLKDEEKKLKNVIAELEQEIKSSTRRELQLTRELKNRFTDEDMPKRMQTQMVRRARERDHFGTARTEALLKRDFWFKELRTRAKEETIEIRILRNDRYDVPKVGEHEGPQMTSTAADHMKTWIADHEDDPASDSVSDSE